MDTSNASFNKRSTDNIKKRSSDNSTKRITDISTQINTTIFNARDLMNSKKIDLINNLPDRFKIQFDNGVIIETTKRKTIYSRFFWKIHSYYPNTLITEKHFVEHVLKGNPLTSKTHIELLSIIFKDVVLQYNLNTPESKEKLLELVYKVTNDLNNDFAKYAEDSIVSIDILDFLNITQYPPIKETITLTEANTSSIANIYKFINKTMSTDPIIMNNPLSRALRAGMINSSQLMQCLAIRGFVTEVDGAILPNPILTSFAKGLTNLYDFIAESRSAAKSLYYSEAPLQDAEYFARKLQLLCMTIESIVHTDCGTDKYLLWKVTPPIKDEFNNVIQASDLKFMLGKYYLNEETNKLQEITHDDPSLYNKIIKIRSSIFCKHENPHKVCAVCFGALSHNVSKYANLGHLCAATMTQQSSQSVLSIKHLDASASSTKIILNDSTSMFFTVNKNRSSYLIKPEIKDKNVKLIINREDAFGLVDIINIEEINNINPSRISAVEFIDVIITDNGTEIFMPVCISQNNRKAIMSMEFIRYIKTYGWETDNKNNFVFDMKKWDYTLPLFKLPEMEYSYSEHSHAIASLIESSIKKLADRQSPDSPVSTLHELFMLANRKLNVNIAGLEIIIYALMTKSKDDFGLARNAENPVLGVSDQIIKNRSLGPAYAYEEQAYGIVNASSFFYNNRPDSVFDTFLCPKEVVDDYGT